jgi:hypothetical protein
MISGYVTNAYVHTGRRGRFQPPAGSSSNGVIYADVTRGHVWGRRTAAKATRVVDNSTSIDRGASDVQRYTEPKLTRATHYPGSTFVLDAPGAPMDRREADLESIEYAVRLGRDWEWLATSEREPGARRARPARITAMACL